MPSPTHADDQVDIAQRILVLRGQRVLLIADLATLYGVTAKRLSEQVRRNRARFPNDFVFSIEINEIRNLMPQVAASSWGGRRGQTLAFTEHGAIMAATVLNSPRAVEMSIYALRSWPRTRSSPSSSRRWRNRSQRSMRGRAASSRRFTRRFGR